MRTSDRDHRGGGRIASTFVTIGLLLRTIPAAAEPAESKSASDALFYEGNTLMAEGRVADACTKFEQSLALVRRGGSLLNVALCQEAAGALAAAAPLFQEALEIAGRDGHPDRQEIARQHLDGLRPKLAWIVVTKTPADELPGLEISCDGALVPRERWGVPTAATPGKHVILASAPGRERFEASVTVGAPGEIHVVQIPLLREPAAPDRAARVSDAALPAPVKAATPPPPRDDDALTHRAQIGAIARVDVDPIHIGARAAVGVTFGVVDQLDVGVSALLGRDLGVEPQLTFFFRPRTALKPLINLALPIFFTSGADAGVRGAAGLQWDLTRHIGIFGQVGGAYFPAAQAGYAHGVFLPSLGAQGRI